MAIVWALSVRYRTSNFSWESYHLRENICENAEWQLCQLTLCNWKMTHISIIHVASWLMFLFILSRMRTDIARNLDGDKLREAVFLDQNLSIMSPSYKGPRLNQNLVNSRVSLYLHRVHWSWSHILVGNVMVNWTQSLADLEVMG